MEKLDIKMIGFDLDDTLLTSNKELTLYTKEVLTKAIRQGIVVLPATGRPLCGLTEEIRNFPGIRYALTANGARLLDMKEGTILYECLVPRETTEKLLNIFLQYDALVEIYYEGVGFAQEDKLQRIHEFFPRQAMAEYVLTTRKMVKDVRRKFEETDLPSDKVQAVFKTLEEKERALKEVLSKVEGIEAVSSLGNNIEVNVKGVNKGSSLVRLGEMLGIRREEIMAFGDGENDIAMMEAVGFGVAMENGLDAVKAAARYITASNNEDGVAKAIEKYVLK
ncbi:MAG: Cof-type HAD-IIB family hydrolase [Lachnoclostridium sp.]